MSHLLITHIAGMGIGFTLLMAQSIATYIASRDARKEVVVSLMSRTKWFGSLGRTAVIIGITIGLILARPYGWSAPWLLGAYLAMTLSIVTGATLLEPFQKKLNESAQAGMDLSSFSQSMLPLYASVTNMMLWILIVWLMVAKPA